MTYEHKFQSGAEIPPEPPAGSNETEPGAATVEPPDSLEERRATSIGYSSPDVDLLTVSALSAYMPNASKNLLR